MKIACLGDSLTFGYGVNSRDNWVSLAQNSFEGQWLNSGICGDTAMGMLVRLNTQVLPQKPQYVLIMGGYNDILITGSIQQAQSAIMAMVHQCAHAGVRPVIGIPIPVLYEEDNPWSSLIDMNQIQDVQREYITWLRLFVRTLHLRNVDFNTTFLTHENIGSLYQMDGLHPNVAGHRHMLSALLESGVWKKKGWD